MDASESERLARLEREVAILRAEFAKLRQHVNAPASSARPVYTAAPPDPPIRRWADEDIAAALRGDLDPEGPRLDPAAAPAPRSEPLFAPVSAPRQSFEEMIGRYGTIAVATVTVLVGVGVFLSWAIQHGYLGPTARVIVGYVGAAGIAALGTWLRIRGTREFGNVLLAIALGVVHLVCWSAGPLLHVMPSTAALAIGFIASALLTEFSLRHDEEMLCAVGFGGAGIAPFVTSDSSGNRIALATYGLAVVALSAAALGKRPWRSARNVTILTLLLYTAVAGGGDPAESPPAWVARRLSVIFPIAAFLALVPFTAAFHRRVLIRTSAVALIVGGWQRAERWGPDVWAMGFAMIGSMLMIGALDFARPGALEREEVDSTDDTLATTRNVIVDALLIPLGLFFATILSTPQALSPESAAIAVLFAVFAAWLAHRSRADANADGYALSSSLIALWIVPAALFHQELARVAASAALGLVLLLTAKRLDRIPFVVGSLAALAVASIWAVLSADARTPFNYVPFGGPQTLGCIVAVAGWLGSQRIVRASGFLPGLDPGLRRLLRRGLIAGASATAFFWGVAELQGAWSPTAAVALLIVYYAATGTLMIWLGRARAESSLRIIGLGLALWAAAKALIETFSIPNVAVRIATFFVVSAFLLAVGYWYRRRVDTDGASVPV